jgi:hypothetical protein
VDEFLRSVFQHLDSWTSKAKHAKQEFILPIKNVNYLKAEQDLPGTEGRRGKGRQGGEMTQTMYAHVNKNE